jgi:hypothetical protein
MRKHLVWVLGLALAIGIANVAVGANFQKITGTFKPNTNLSKTKYKAGSVNVITETGDADGTVSPATRAKVFFDDDLRFTTRGIPKCDPAKLVDTSTEEAKSRCRSAIVGAGEATVALGGQSQNPNALLGATVTAFNGPPKNGKPVILLHSRTDPPLNSTVVLVGILKPLPRAGDFGNVLDVTIPQLPGNTAITRFQVKVQRNFRVAGKRKSYVSGRCGDNNKQLNYKGTFIFDGSPSKTALDSQACTR